MPTCPALLSVASLNTFKYDTKLIRCDQGRYVVLPVIVLLSSQGSTSKSVENSGRAREKDLPSAK